MVNYLKEIYSKYGQYFPDIWQYIVIIATMALAAIFVL